MKEFFAQHSFLPSTPSGYLFAFALLVVVIIAALKWYSDFLETKASENEYQAAITKIKNQNYPLSLLCDDLVTLNFDNPLSKYILACEYPKHLHNKFAEKHIFYGYSTDKHLLTIAPTRAGKGRGLILPNLLDLPNHSVFVIDPKGENALVSATYRKSQGHEIIIFNPYGIYADEFSKRGFTQFQSFNPLKNLDPESESFHDDTAIIAESLIYDTGGDSHWTESARGLVEFLITYLVTEPTEQPTLERLRKIIEKKHDGIKEIRIKCKASDYESVCDNILRYDDSDSREVEGILSTAETQTRILKSKVICKALDGEAFDFENMKYQKTSVYLILPSERLITQARYLRLVLLVALSHFMRSEKGNHKVLMMLDEFANLGALKVIENGYGLIAGHGVTLWSFVQNLTQLQNLYKNNWEAFIANSAVVTVSNINDVTTAEYFNKRAGKELVQRVSISSGSSSGSSSNISHNSNSMFASGNSSGSNISESTGKSISFVWEDSFPVSSLYGMSSFRGLVFLEGQAKPAVVKKIWYDISSPFYERADKNPLHEYRYRPSLPTRKKPQKKEESIPPTQEHDLNLSTEPPEKRADSSKQHRPNLATRERMFEQPQQAVVNLWENSSLSLVPPEPSGGTEGDEGKGSPKEGGGG